MEEGVKIKGNKIVFLVAIFLLFLLYFVTRIYKLTNFPIFADEAIYIRWAQIMKNEPSLRFLPLQDGKQPLFMWLIIPFLGIFEDPLFAGRLVSVLAGFGTMLGLGAFSFLTTQNFKMVLFSMFLYILAPFTLFFDRMALVDSLLSAFGVWSLVFAILLGKTQRLDVAMILGMILGGALITKSPGMFFVLMAPVATVLSSKLKVQSSKLQSKVQSCLQLLSLLGVSLVFAFAIYNVLRLGPNFHMIGIRNKDYVWPISEILKHPLNPFIPHLKDIARYYWSYLTFPVLVLGILGILGLLGNIKTRSFGIILFGWWAFPLLVQAVIAKVFTARYILFSIAPVILFASYGLRVGLEKIEKLTHNSQTRNWLTGLTVLLILLPSLYFDWQLWHNPTKAPLPKDEYAGYLEDWTAGWGIKEVADYLRGLPKDENIVVGTEGFFGTLPDGLQIYLEGEKNITVIGVGVPVGGISDSLLNAKKAGDRVYLVVNQSRLYIQSKDREKLRLIAEHFKPGGDKLLLFELEVI